MSGNGDRSARWTLAGAHLRFAGPAGLAIITIGLLLVSNAGSGLPGGHVAAAALLVAASKPPPGPYPTYLYNLERTNAPPYQAPFNQSNIGSLQPNWSYSAGAYIWSEPIVVSGVVYFGSNDGYEYALSASNGSLLWRTYLGVDAVDRQCHTSPGITSTAAYLNGKIYVGGGDNVFYALNAVTGKIAWKLRVGGTGAEGFYIWSSPALYNGSAYLGLSSQCDHPLVPAGLERVSLATGKELAYFNTSTPNPNGSSIWGSPSVNPLTNTVFVTTGNPYLNLTSTYGESALALNASTLRVQASWQVPAAQAIFDGDFGVTPNVFNLSNGLGVITGENKNGYLYEWYQSNLSLVWEDKIGKELGDHYSTAESNGTIYAIAHGLKLGKKSYNSSVSAVNSSDGAYLWQFGTNSSPVSGYGAPLVLNGMVLAPIGTNLYILKAATGQLLHVYSYSTILVPSVSVGGGLLFVVVGPTLYALSVPSAGTLEFGQLCSSALNGPTSVGTCLLLQDERRSAASPGGARTRIHGVEQ